MDWRNWFKSEKSLNTARPVNTNNGLWKTIQEPSTGAWERNQELQLSDSLTSYAVFSCISLISKDVGKLPLVAKTEENGVRTNIKLKGLDVINKPNKYQSRQQFFESWINSKTTTGNTYVLKVRDVYGDVEQYLILDSNRTTVLSTSEGDVWYRVNTDPLNATGNHVDVPASEIIHDRYNCLYHPLVGLSPIMACGLAANTGLNIQNNVIGFFGNNSVPTGIITTPQPMEDEEAKLAQDRWNSRYSKRGDGGVSILSGGTTYQSVATTAADSQMLEHLKLSGEVVCSTFNIPAFKVGLGAAPSGTVEYLNSIYYSDCLQHYIESIENLLNLDLDLPSNVYIEFDTKSLFRMDSNSQMGYLKEGVGSGIFSPNEARAELGKPPVEGGDSPVMQQQNYSLSALSRRDNQSDPFSPEALTAPLEAPVVPQATNATEEVLEAPSDKLKAIYQGVFNPNTEYGEGSFITHKGSLWHCDNKHQGEFDYKNFTLAVKKGEANNVTNS